MRAGILGFDLQKGDWAQADGKTNIESQIYDSVFKNKYAPYSQQQSIAFADLYHGSNVWVSENPSPAKLSALLDTAEDVLKNAATHYSEKTLLALQTAYDKAKSYKDAEYNFGKAYFDLRDAIKGLQEANSIFVSILGNAERQKVLTEYVVHTPGLSYLEILQTACAENGMTIATSDQEITEVDGLQKVSGSAWYVYDGEVRKTNLQQIPGEGTVITLKYCLDTQAVGEAATLDEHLLLEAEAALNLGDISAATQDLTLPDMGRFGVAISWISDKPANITDDGRITRSNNMDEILPATYDTPADVIAEGKEILSYGTIDNYQCYSVEELLLNFREGEDGFQFLIPGTRDEFSIESMKELVELLDEIDDLDIYGDLID